MKRFLFMATALLCGLASAEVKTLVVVAGSDLLAREYRAWYAEDKSVEVVEANLATAFPYTQLGRQKLGRENLFGTPRPLPYDRVLLILDAKARLTETGVEIVVKKGETIDLGAGKPFHDHLAAFAPNAKAVEVVLVLGHSGGLPSKTFAGPVTGLTLAESGSATIAMREFCWWLTAQRTGVTTPTPTPRLYGPPPLTAKGFYEAWRRAHLEQPSEIPPPWFDAGTGRVVGQKTRGIDPRACPGRMTHDL